MPWKPVSASPTEHVLRQLAKYLVRKSRCAVPARAHAESENFLDMAGAALGGAKLASPRRDLARGALDTGFREPHRTCFTTVSKVPSAQIPLRRVRARARGAEIFSQSQEQRFEV